MAKAEQIAFHVFRCGWCQASVTVEGPTFREAYIHLRTVDRWIDAGSRQLCPQCAADVGDALRDAPTLTTISADRQKALFQTPEGSLISKIGHPSRGVFLQLLIRGDRRTLDRHAMATLYEQLHERLKEVGHFGKTPADGREPRTRDDSP